ncbi:HAD family hydrolase, partial [Candidatus Woesebacteria bacterium]|nr:HAD family hydrolase [Candidatus Woesebacteria bacterium]
PVILFDLDRTMMNTSALTVAFKVHFDEQYAALGITTGRFDEWTRAYVLEIGSRTKFDPENLIHYWAEQLTAAVGREKAPSHELLLERFVSFIQNNARLYLYKETLGVLGELRDLGCTLCLFTQGVETWQKLKFAHAALADYFDPDLQFVSEDKSSPAFLETIRAVLEGRGCGEQEVWAVDDTLMILKNAKSHWPELTTILVDRAEEQADAVTVSAVDAVISNLNQVVEMVRDRREVATL